MNDKYYEQAVTCVKDRVLPAQMELYRSCNGDLDRIYGEAMNGNGYFGKVIEPGHVYDLAMKNAPVRKFCPDRSQIRITVIAAGRAFYISSAVRSRTVNLKWTSWKPS